MSPRNHSKGPKTMNAPIGTAIEDRRAGPRLDTDDAPEYLDPEEVTALFADIDSRHPEWASPAPEMAPGQIPAPARPISRQEVESILRRIAARRAEAALIRTQAEAMAKE